jgi:hypothetical protein
MKRVLLWDCVLWGESFICSAVTRSKARYKCWQAAREAGHKPKFGDITVRRIGVSSE